MGVLLEQKESWDQFKLEADRTRQAEAHVYHNLRRSIVQNQNTMVESLNHMFSSFSSVQIPRVEVKYIPSLQSIRLQQLQVFIPVNGWVHLVLFTHSIKGTSPSSLYGMNGMVNTSFHR